MSTTINLSSTTPAAPTGTVNAAFQNDGSGDISANVPIATTSVLGLVRPDGTSITVSSGVISSAGLTNPMTTAGDIIYGGTSGTPTRLAAGTPGYLLQTNGASAPTWVAAPSGGGGGGMTLISTSVLGTTTASVTFSSIPGTYNCLQVVGVGRLTGSNYGEFCNVQFNGDTGANYIDEIIYAIWNVTPSGVTSGNGATSVRMFAVTGGNSTGGECGSFTFNIPGYAGTAFQKQANGQGSFTQSGASGGVQTYTTAGQWVNTAAITSIKLFAGSGNSFVTGTSFYLYGY